MRVSTPILPIRIYDDLFDQQRFNVHSAKAEQLDIVHPAHELPSFQFFRDKSVYAPSMFFLRNVCEDAPYNYGYYKQVAPPADKFSTFAAENFYPDVPKIGATFNDGVNPPVGTFFEMGKYSCNKLVNTDVDPQYTIAPGTSGVFTIPLIVSSGLFSFKIIVDKLKLSGGSSFTIRLRTGGISGTVIGVISAPGIYNYTFNAAGADVTLEFRNYQQGDLYEISYVQASLNTYTANLGSDVVLDETQLTVIPMQGSSDLINYCEAGQNYAPAPGYYYYVINVNNQKFFFSEVFKIVSLLEIEKYYQLKWTNTCDINNYIIYRPSVLLCTFYNVLYLDAALFNPEPETSNEGTTAGDGSFNSALATWKNFLNFEILKSPQFLTDALSGILLHDTITIKKPINLYQEINTNVYTVKQIIPDVQSVLQDCFSKVNLKMLLREHLSVTGCCNEAEIFAGNTLFRYAAGSPPCTEDFDYVLQLTEMPAEGDGLINCSTGEIVEVLETEYILFNGQYWTLTLLDGIYQPLAVLPNMTAGALLGGVYTMSGAVIPNTIAVVQTSKDGAGYIDRTAIAVGDDGAFTYDMPDTLTTGAADFKVRVHCVTFSDDFGYSDIIDLI